MGKKRFPENKKNILVAVVLIAVAFILMGGILGVWSARQMRKDVTGQFNEEQGVVAANIAGLIERELNTLKKELFLLSKEITLAPFSPEASMAPIQKTFSRVLESGVWKIDISDVADQKIYRYRPHRQLMVAEGDIDIGRVSSDHEHGETMVSVSQPRVVPSGIVLVLSVLLPEDSSMLLRFEVNVSWLLTPFLRDVRSGKTGYSWLIDQNGVFLFHPKTDFIGKNAFDIRKKHYPDIPLGIIDFIQKEKMLNGQTGTGWYYSGWHRGITGKIKKLIAYCPVLVSENPSQKWSIAVVAPISEIEKSLRSGHLRQYIFQGLVILVILLGAATIIFFEIRWSKILETRIDERTGELKKSEEKYRSLVESAEDFIFTVDSEGNFQSMNSFTANFFGGRPEDFLDKDLSFLFPGEVAVRQLKLVKLVYKFGKSVRDEFEIDPGDHQIWINANFMPLKDEEGHVTAVLCIARDITDNKTLERQLINTEKLASMGTLAAGVAHEINNPLGVILGFCDLLLRNTNKDTQVYEDLKTIERQGLLCKQVVENLLSFARLGGEVSEISDLNQCLEEIIKVVNHTLELNDIALKVKLDDNLPPVVGDSRQLQQVFLNLINNAVAAMPEGGVLILKTYMERASRRAVAVFQDDGIGIRPEDMDHIYEPFFTTKPEGTGTGLGLFVSYGIITKFGGSIECVSHTEEGRGRLKGTVFTIKLLTRKQET